MKYQLQISLMIPAAVYCYPSGYKKVRLWFVEQNTKYEDVSIGAPAWKEKDTVKHVVFYIWWQ